MTEPVSESNPVTIPEAEVKPVYAVAPNNPKDAWPYFRSGSETCPWTRRA